MSSFWQRALSGAVFVCIMLGATVIGQWTFVVLFFGITLIGVSEYNAMMAMEHTYFSRNNILLTTAAVLLAGVVAIVGMMPLAVAVGISLVCLVAFFIAEMFRNKPRPFMNVAISITAIVYVVVPFLLFMYLPFQNAAATYNYQMVLGYFILQWSSDTFQYLFGISMGKHKLFARISPKKSWEGFIGGLVATMAIGYFMPYFFDFLAWWQWLAIAAIVVIFGTLGDLAESMLKRSVGVKDSGSLMPGHGGVLDRFDGVLGSAPFVYVFILLTS